ncbi:MAG: hypothetical protein DLM68_08960, partial [Hyphomicrobiales bacterium]
MGLYAQRFQSNGLKLTNKWTEINQKFAMGFWGARARGSKVDFQPVLRRMAGASALSEPRGGVSAAGSG